MRRLPVAVLVALAFGGLVIATRRRSVAGSPVASADGDGGGGRATAAASRVGLPVRSRTARNAAVARLAAGRAADAAATRVRGSLSPAERRRQLRLDLERRHARDVVDSLGRMKGALMKLGQMASYLDDGLPEHLRLALAELQQDAPPMDPLLAVGEIERELGAPLRRNFRRFDEVPIAAASIGQVHGAMTADGTEVVVKVQYPGIADAIAADLDNTELLGTVLGMAFPGLEPAPLVAELRTRLSEELDYRIEADNQQLFADFFAGHPFIHIPGVFHDVSTRRVLVTERAYGARFAELEARPAEQRTMAAETIFRFVFRSLYRLRAFNGDPHPGNYLFGTDGHVTFLDFGLVKRFAPDETAIFQGLITSMLADDSAAFRRTLETGRLLQRGAPFTDDEIHAWFAHYYEIVRSTEPIALTPEYASSVIRHTFDASANEILKWANVPPAFALIQRINLGLLALLARLGASANYRRIAEELWPWVDAGPSTPLGEAEAAWRESGGGRLDGAR